MPKVQIRSDKLRQPSGVFSHATAIEAKGRLVFISGMTARRLDGTMAGIGDIEAQTRQVFQNIGEILKAGGASFDAVVSATVYLADMNDFTKVNEIYATYFSAPAPARATVQVARLPKDCKVEIQVIASL